MTEEEKIISNTSYVNKDFQSIYTELLDLVKKLTNKWDPSISNESDPGVILLKLNALIADKNNYNIDKNVLECFPLSVTQTGNARKLYDSLGYRMKWYRSATSGVLDDSSDGEGIGFKLIDKNILPSESAQISIPAFTVITDSSGQTAYSTLQEVTLTADNYTNPVYNIPVIQGISHEYLINGEALISVENLDENLRLYFEDTHIAENGIFIRNADTGDFYRDQWVEVDNLASYPLGNKVFQFGVLPNTDTCYIQFPEDIASQAAGGLNIRYVVSDGSAGNIKSNILSDFIDNITIGEGSEIQSAAEYIKILQSNSITNGKDPESLDEAYNNYKKTIGTFNTLVTRRDYENFLYNSKQVSNAVVADRTCDLNITDYVMQWDASSPDNKVLIQNPADTLTAYNIVMYLLQLQENINNADDYEKTFTPNIDAGKLLEIAGLIDNYKSVQHDLILPTNYTSQEGFIKFNFNNLYTIKGTLYTYYNVTTEEKQDIEDNVLQALFDTYNARYLNYGEALDYLDVSETIKNADKRIKSVVISKFDFNTKLRTLNNRLFDLELNKDTTNTPYNINIADEVVAKSIMTGTCQLFKHDTRFKYEFGQHITDNKIHENIVNIESAFTKTLPESVSEESAGYPLKKNEIIQLISPNYVTQAEYSTYVRYKYSGSPIPADIRTVLTSPLYIEYYDANNLRTEKSINIGQSVELNFELTSTLADNNWHSLDSGKYIRVKIKNESTINSNTNYIFLSTRDVEISPSDNGYLLNDNEYFIYPDSTRTDLVILGSGTQLQAPTESITLLATELKNLDQYTRENLENINWNTLQNDLNTTEMEIITLGQNTYVKANTDTIECTNTFRTLQPEEEVFYRPASSRTFESKKGSDWQIRSRLIIDTSVNSPQLLSSDQSITLTFESSSIDPVVIESGNVVFDTPVLSPGGKINVSNLNCMVFTYDSGFDLARSGNIYKITANTNLPIDTFGVTATSKDTQWLVPVKIHIGTADLEITCSNCTLYDPTSTSSSSTSITFSESGTYILQIVNPISANFGITFSLTSGLDPNTDFVEVGYLTKLAGMNLDEIESDIIPWFKLASASTTGGTRFNNICNYIKTLSNNTYDWTYVVPNTAKILYPASPESFWNINHVYNKYVIPKFNFSTSSLVVNPGNVN